MGHRGTMYKEIYSYLYSEIKKGVYSPGQLIPPEKDLMKKFGVSRMTTNRALQMLSLEGVIERKAGIGSFVAEKLPEPSPSSVASPSKVQQRVQKGASIGFIVPFFSGIYGITLISELVRLLDEKGMSLVIASSYAEQEQEKRVIERLVSLGVAGLVVFPVNGDFYNSELLRLHVEEFPIVIVDKHLPGIPVPYIATDNEQAARTVTKHLLDLGHHQIAFVSPPLDNTTSLVNRYAGFQSTMAAAQLTVNPAHVLTNCGLERVKYEDYSEEHLTQLTDFLKGHPEVSAVIATDYGLAEHLLEAAKRAGRTIPETLSIACFDGPVPKQNQWNFTHIMQDEKGMASHTVDILMQLMDENKDTLSTMDHKLPADLFIGQSTGPRA